MPIPSGYSRTVISGHMPNGEIFQTGFWCDEAPSTQAATQTQAADFAEDLTGSWGNAHTISGMLSTDTGIDLVTAYSYLDGSGKATYVGESTVSLAGTVSAPTMPNQCAVAMTLQTGMAGRRHRGRMYWPVNAGALNNGELSNTAVSNAALWLSALITAWNARLGDQHVVVLSQVAGTSAPVTAVRVNSTIDTQRRRAASQSITYSLTEPVTG
jgi:hypothetical protein